MSKGGLDLTTDQLEDGDDSLVSYIRHRCV